MYTEYNSSSDQTKVLVKILERCMPPIGHDPAFFLSNHIIRPTITSEVFNGKEGDCAASLSRSFSELKVSK